ncbi:limonene hydroxylase [Peptococcaceae bacterium CEB3]|nr:limonene hydroxylase [Peptococcaceae bacterium CEB3]
MQTTEDPSIAAIVGKSPQILDLKQAVLKVAPRNTTVLITGETGTGKELFAQALHQGSLRRFKPFVRVNCAAIPEALLESELFGYAEGTFTGGKKGGYLGKFALADGGTVFLDELAELPLALQAKLLRFLEEHEIQRLGESLPRRVNVRVVAATNANLAQLVKYKKFRSDLYYRINVVTLEIPPLRSRREDIPVLTRAFMKQLNVEYDYRVYRLDADIQRILDSYHWPGNVRELRNILETAFNLHDGGQELNAGYLPPYLRRWFQEQTERAKTLGLAAGTSAIGQVESDAIREREEWKDETSRREAASRRGGKIGRRPGAGRLEMAREGIETGSRCLEADRTIEGRGRTNEDRDRAKEARNEAREAGNGAKEVRNRVKETEGGVGKANDRVTEGADGTNEEESRMNKGDRTNKEDRRNKEDRADGEWDESGEGRDGANEAITWAEWVNMIGRRPLVEITDLFEGKLLVHLLGSGCNRTEMAAMLGISRQALYKKLQKYHPEK